MATGTELAFSKGGSDKFYRASAWEAADGTGQAVVQWGRAGTAGQTKQTSYPTAADADDFVAKQVKAKKAKGYLIVGTSCFEAPDELSGFDSAFAGGFTAGSEAEAAADEEAMAVAVERAARLAAEADYIATATLDDIRAAVGDRISPRPTGPAPTAPLPQLAEAAETSGIELGLMLDGAGHEFLGQWKLDGDRMMVVVRDGAVAVLNRQGQPKVTNLPPAVVASFAPFVAGTWVFDGEVVGRTLHLFDLRHAEGYIDGDDPFSQRHQVLDAIVVALGSPHVAVVSIHTDKRALLAEVEAARGEGIIVRSSVAPYIDGGRGHGLYKLKLLKEADVFVAELPQSKASAVLAVFDAEGNEVVVGSASTIGKGTLALGSVVEVRFAHVLDPAQPRMVQPRIVRIRTDKDPSECSVDQFLGAGTDKSAPSALT